MKIVKRINSMYVVVEIPLWNKLTKKFDKYPGDLKVIPDKSHSCYNQMWEWDRINRQEWYREYGDLFDEVIKKFGR